MTNKAIKNIHSVSVRKPLLGVVSAAVLLMPFLLVSGCNEPASVASTNKAEPPTQVTETTPVDEFQLVEAFDQRKLRLSDDAIQIGLPTEIATFKPGLNSDLAQTACADCHSADYPTTQPVMTRAKWKATIAKMGDKFFAPWGDIFGTIDAAGVPVSADAATVAVNLQKIEDYLVKNYGTEI